MKELQALSIVAPGFFGLNTQDSGVTLSSNWAQLVDNVIIDKYGRLGARKGWVMQTTDGATELSGNPITFMLEHYNADSTTTILSAGNNKIFKGGIGAVLTDITPGSYTITADNWRGATLGDHAMLVQESHEPLIYSEEGTPNLVKASSHTAHGAWTPSYGSSYPKDVIAAYGRFWAHDGSTVYWSDDIAGAFPLFSGGSSGTLNIASVLPNNVDTIEALAAHNNFLIIFCKKNIVVYSGADDPGAATFALSDVIAGVGCIARNSVQNTGNDLVFLSDTGIRSLGRLIQEKSMPMRDLTKNIRDDFMKDVNTELANNTTLDGVVGLYSEVNAFYLIAFPSTETVYVLDMRQALEDGSARCTLWYQYPVHSFLRTRDRNVLVGKTNGIGKYQNYSDNGTKYRLRYFSHFLSFDNSTLKKILKQIKTTVLGGSGQQFTIKVGVDYEGSYRTFAYNIETGASYEYGVAKYPEYSEFKGTVANYAALPGGPSTGDAYMTLDNNSVYQWDGASWIDKTSTWEDEFTLVNFAEFAGGVVLDTIKSSVAGSGNVIQIGFEADVNGSELSVQAIDCFVKTGRIS